jgi:hypothetical protein
VNFEMHARVIDYLGNDGHSASEKFSLYLRYLGYTTSYEVDATQHGASCAIVAARLTSQLQLAKHLGNVDWFALNVTDAASRMHVLEANQLIETNTARHTNAFTRFLRGDEAQLLHAHWVVCGAEQIRSARLGAVVSCAICSSASHATGSCCVPSEWVPSGPGVSLDQGYLQLAELTRGFFSNPRDNDGVPRDMFLTQVINTDDSRASGYHWFTVAVSLRLNHVEPEPMDLDERG